MYSSLLLVTYTYDGDGQRVKKSSGTLYWRGGNGSVVAETDTSGNSTNEYIFFGARIARRDSGGNVYYYFGNHLGSAAITNAAGTLCYDADFYPLGGELAFTNTCSQSYKFAGMEQDPETGEYHTEFRQYASNLGRWLSPDPSGTAAVSLSNPQTWNMYAYATNNPTTLTDATGLDSNAECYEYYCQPMPDPYYEASYDETYDPNSWLLPNPINCMAGEYGCAGTQSQIDVAEAAYASNFVWEVTYKGETYDFATLGDYFDWMTTVVAAAQKEAYSDAMRDKLAALFGEDPSALTPLGLRGGNANFAISQDLWNEIDSSMGCSAPGAFGIRCDDGIHLSDPATDFQYGQGVLWVHMDSANPYSGIGGKLAHFGLDFILGSWIWDSGVPH